MDINEVKSIISLLDDPDEKVFESIKDIIVENFGDFSGLLTRRLKSSCSEVEKMRISQLAQLSISNIFKNDFLDYTAKLSPEPSLLAGIVMVEKITDNTFDEHAFTHYVRELSRKVWMKTGDNTGIENVRIIRDIFENEHIHESQQNGKLCLNGIFSAEDKPLPKYLFNLILLTVCQENSINIRPVVTPAFGGGMTIEIGYADKETAKMSGIPSKNGVLFAIDQQLQIKHDPKILLGEPLPYYKYLKLWQMDRYRTLMANENKYPGYYTVIMGKITEVLQNNIKY